MAVSDNLRGAALMCAAMVAFTVNDTFMKAVTVDLPVLQAIAMRGVVTSVFLLAIAWRAGAFAAWPGRADRFWLAMRTLGEVLGTLTFLFALKHMPIANLSAILQFLPLAVTLAAAVFLGTPVGWRRLTAILIGFAGVMMIIRPGTEAFDRWSLLGVVSVACVVLRDIATRKLSAEVPSPLVALAAALSVGLSAGLLLPFTGVVAVSAVQLAQVAGAAAFLIVGYLTVVMTMRVGDISVIAPFRYVSLVAAILLGWAAFGEFPDRWTLSGSAIVVATGIYTFLRERRLAQQAETRP
ncbi:DMT family transporter [Frigidibacter sp. RF13]|uniref:DMT family transporter n=1 Tax=Frigidibacter sp. RF13 TaxID=2997340 RepID=UPI00226E1937|nr:DMT family transporter [Frigidibacter sp. RF13]MCY1127852.1 DMT family transporter [Frigidibacter sp. RF13]